MNIEPTGQYIIVKIETRDETASGILLPESAAIAKRSRVVACGPDVKVCAVGDYVCIHPRAQVMIFEEDATYGAVDSEAVFAIDKRISSELVRTAIVMPETLQ